MIDYIEQAGHEWGAQRRRIVLGGFVTDGVHHRDGFNRSSLLARIREFGDGAGQRGHLHQHFAEVYTGEGLAFQRALVGVREHWRLIAELRYVVPNRVVAGKQKLAYLQQHFPRQFSGRQRYYEQLELFHNWLAGRWPRSGETTHAEGSQPAP